MKQFEGQCQAHGIDLKQSLLCCEHTGIYSHILLDFALNPEVALWLESSIRIKRSVGLQRGKSDKRCPAGIDAMRIAEYAYRHADQAVIWQPTREVLVRLKQLVAMRKRFITTKHALNVPIKEASPFQNKKLQKELRQLNEKPIKVLEEQIKEVEKKIRILIKEDDILAHLFEIVTSVSGVGEAAAAAVVFWEMVTSTNEFKRPSHGSLPILENSLVTQA